MTLICPTFTDSTPTEPCNTIFDCATSMAGFQVYTSDRSTLVQPPYDCTQQYSIRLPWVGCDGNRITEDFVGLSSSEDITFDGSDNTGAIPQNWYLWNPPNVTGPVSYSWGSTLDPQLCSVTLMVECEETQHGVLSPDLRAIPGIYGHGAQTSGGRGGRVVKVTNRNDSGSGSLRDALESSGTRQIVFVVGGVFYVNSPIQITDPNITIYGQTAPGGGVTVAFPLGHSLDAAPILIRASDVVAMHIRSRPYPSTQVGTTSSDAISIDGRTAARVVLVHCSVSFATDENLEAWFATEDITVALCSLAQGLRNSTGSDPTNHNYSAIFGNDEGQPYGKGLSFYWNLCAHNIGRSPRLGATTEYDIFQNVIYNQLNFGTEVDSRTSGLTTEGNVEQNCYIDGPSTPSVPFGGNVRFTQNGGGPNSAFVSGNTRELMNGSVGPVVQSGNFNNVPQRFECERPALKNKADLLDFVLDNVGPKQRDGTDARVVSEVRSKTGSNSVSCVDNSVPTSDNNNCALGSVPFLPAIEADSNPLLDDSQPDCVPNDWKVQCGFEENQEMNLTFDAVGYSMLEHYIDQAFCLVV